MRDPIKSKRYPGDEITAWRVPAGNGKVVTYVRSIVDNGYEGAPDFVDSTVVLTRKETKRLIRQLKEALR